MNTHELDSVMIFIHPTLAIAGYVFIFLFTIALFISHRKEDKKLSYLGSSSWLLTTLGLVAGMIWAQTAWGSYWSWDPKETLTLLLLVAFTASLIAYYEKKPKISKLSAIVACILSVSTAASSFITTGLHSFI
jgi:ABC-type transport system involved in cytochrome c biogenesis permease subunit